MINKESFNPLINAFGSVAIAVVVYIFAGNVAMLPLEQKLALFAGLFVAALIIQYVVDLLKNIIGINALSVLKRAEKVVDVSKQPAPTPAPAPAFDIIQTKFGVFKRNRTTDSAGTYFGKADLGKGSADAVYIDIEFWKAVGGKQIKTASIPENMGLYPILSRLGPLTDGAYFKSSNLIFGLADDVFAMGIAEEEKQRQLIKSRAVAAYNKWKGLDGTGKEVTIAQYDTILPEIAAAGLTLEQLIALMQK